MSDLKPIVPGCLAVVIFPEKYRGTEVRVEEAVNGRVYGNRLFIQDDEERAFFVTRIRDGLGGFWNGRNLMRIDGFEEDKDITEIMKELKSCIE